MSLTRPQFETVLQQQFDVDDTYDADTKAWAILDVDYDSWAEIRLVRDNLDARVQDYLAQWDSAPNQTAKDAVVASVVTFPADYAPSQSQIDDEVDVIRNLLETELPILQFAWAYSNSAGTVGDSKNVSSVTRNSTGNYTVAFATAFPSAQYHVDITPIDTDGVPNIISISSQTTAGFTFQFTGGGATLLGIPIVARGPVEPDIGFTLFAGY